MKRYICIHGHFYQPPRENPWLEEVELQDSAYPYHDWNERVSSECYTPNTASRILDAKDNIIEIVNNYSKISYNFGPTLLSWLERHLPETYRAIIEADRISQKKFSGHGSALAQVYNHIIMPLANSRDKETQIIWGIADFVRRFMRSPEGMWLAETAVDLETLDLMAKHGIKFVILAPKQAEKIRKRDEDKWTDVHYERINTKEPYFCKLPSGNTINIFFYDNPISVGVAFKGLLKSGEGFAKSLTDSFTNTSAPQLAHIATDGETFGHHHHFGDMALSYALHYIEKNKLANITIYGEYLEKYPPTSEVKIIENSSWSCAHGVERWRSDCGCSMGAHAGWNQKWRKPLRENLDWLRDKISPVYEKEMSAFFNDPWDVRNKYIKVILNRTELNVDNFFGENTRKELSDDDKIKILSLLEMQRHALLMFTSCGWFFDDISGIESTQLLAYSARVMQLAKKTCNLFLEPDFVENLQTAESNIPYYKNGGFIYATYIKPSIIDALRVGSHFAISSIFKDYPDNFNIYCYSATINDSSKIEAGKLKLVIGNANVKSNITKEEAAISYAFVHMGDHNINGGVREAITNGDFSKIKDDITAAFKKSNTSEIIRLMDNYFKTHNYSLVHLFKDEQRTVLKQILQSPLNKIDTSLKQLFDSNYPIMNFINSLNTPLPHPLRMLAKYVVNMELHKYFESEVYATFQLEKIVREFQKWSLKIDTDTFSFLATPKINHIINQLSKTPLDVKLLETAKVTIELILELNLKFEFWKAQNIYFTIRDDHYDEMLRRKNRGDITASKWVELFDRLGIFLQVTTS